MNSEDFKCNTCGDYVGEEGVWGLCDPCFDKEGGNEALAKSFGHGEEAGLSMDRLIGRGECIPKTRAQIIWWKITHVKRDDWVAGLGFLILVSLPILAMLAA